MSLNLNRRVFFVKTLYSIPIILGIGFLAACSGNEAEQFETKEEAVNAFIEQEKIEGAIDAIVTTKDDELLVVEARQDVYFVAELIEKKGHYYAERISSNVVLETDGGAAWELTTAHKNNYTIYFDDEQADLLAEGLPVNDTTAFSSDYYIAFVEGQQIVQEEGQLKSAIEEVKRVNE